jgi:hypothetical protein
LCLLLASCWMLLWSRVGVFCRLLGSSKENGSEAGIRV